MNFSYKSAAKQIENDAQAVWNVLGSPKFDAAKPTYYLLHAFPYPSATGLHIGHPLGYIGGDVNAIFHRMMGYNVFQPFGFDSFGLPAEQFAIKTGQHPKTTTEESIDNFTKQLKSLSLTFNWENMLSTCDPEYYKWTQWIFLEMHGSFFDPTEIWQDDSGNKLVGKAKPISVLRKYIESGKWHITDKGIAKPGAGHKNKYSDDDIKNALDSARLAYLGTAEVNWCPELGTVLANEEVTKDNRSERGNFPVEKRKMKQWMLRIKAYADRLLDGLETVNWPENTVKMQSHWIGRSTGMELIFKAEADIHVFTTRPDTIMGVTFISVAQDHPFYGCAAQHLDELPVSDEKLGHFTGHYATHPITGEQIPIWVANYVLSSYGSGAVMGVPAHDQRDYEFAKKYNLAILPAIMPPKEWLSENIIEEEESDTKTVWLKNPANFLSAFTGEGDILSASDLGMSSEIFGAFETKDEVMNYLAEKGIGTKQKMYRLRDWVFSRQRYWGEPIPIVYDEDGNAYPLHENELPLMLPDEFMPPVTGRSEPMPPLAQCDEWRVIKGEIVDGKVRTKNGTQTFYREANTMPNWAGSSQYYTRYLDAHNTEEFVSHAALDKWCKTKHATVDLYIIGSEHTVLHLLYARFWHMFLYDRGYLVNAEPWQKIVHQGMITANAYKDQRGQYVDKDEVTVQNGVAWHNATGEMLEIVHGKMGKSYKNGIAPEDVCAKYSVDVFRLHMMYMAPVEQTRDWQSDSIVGMERFCQNVCKLAQDILDAPETKTDHDVLVKLHEVIKSVAEGYQNFHINTAISAIIELCNMINKNISVADFVHILTLLAPCAPHLCEYWYQQIRKLGDYAEQSILHRAWPQHDETLIQSKKISVPVQVNGKLKFVLELDRNETEDAIKSQIREKLPDFDKHKFILVRKDNVPRIVNLVGG